jgi:branched-chain amino acid transport system ATP-binding protein
MTTGASEPLLALTNVNTFYGQAQVHFDLSASRRR